MEPSCWRGATGGERDADRSLKRIRYFLEAANGQTPENAKLYLREIVAIAEDGELPPGWRQMVANDYPQHVSLLDWVTRYDFYDEPRKPAQGGRDRPPTPEEGKLVTEHLPLVRKFAVQRASKINNLAGGTTLDHGLLAELERIGLKVLEEQVGRWEPARGVTFGAFAKLRVAGAMDNYLARERIRTVSSTASSTASSRADAREKWKSEASGTRAKGNRTSTGGRKIKSYAETPKPHPPRLIPASPGGFGAELALAIAQLTPNQRAVYEGRVLADPPLSHGDLAARLQVSRPRIVALEKNARQRISKLLRGVSE
jgi:DNA-directed RNA polymerase specialized sigma subunit